MEVFSDSKQTEPETLQGLSLSSKGCSACVLTSLQLTFSRKDSGAGLKVFQEGGGQSNQRNPRPRHPQVVLRNSGDKNCLKVTGHWSPRHEDEQQQLKGKRVKGREDLKYSPQSGGTLATPGVRAGSIWLPSADWRKDTPTKGWSLAPPRHLQQTATISQQIPGRASWRQTSKGGQLAVPKQVTLAGEC